MTTRPWAGIYGRGGGRDIVRANAMLPAGAARSILSNAIFEVSLSDGVTVDLVQTSFGMVSQGFDLSYSAELSNTVFIISASFTENVQSLEAGSVTFSWSAPSFDLTVDEIQELFSASFSAITPQISQALLQDIGITALTVSATDFEAAQTSLNELLSSSFSIASSDFYSSYGLETGSVQFGISNQDLEAVYDEILELLSTSLKFSISDISMPVVLSIGDALNTIIQEKLRSLGYRGSLNDMLYDFFAVDAKELNDRERLWLVTATGITEGSTQDLWEVYLNSLGYSGSFNDMLKQFWINY